jgi:uncharacterized protein YndB with AHSA1/START domain
VVEVTREVLVKAAPDEVWEALTEPDQLASWFATEAELEAAPGGIGRFGWDDGTHRDAVVEMVEEERAFVFRWGTTADDESRVAITLEQVEGGTRVTVTESALGALARLGEWSGALVLLSLLVGTPALA